ncbi:MAG: serine/threonine-protein kinase [Paracoccaceae bacterium]
MTASKPGDIFQPGDLLNNTYRIESLLGRGGTSEVYKARSEISGRVVALKALKSEFSMNDDYLVLMTREEDIRDVRHDAIVRYYDNQRMPDGQVYLVMDFVDGPGLDEKLKAGGMSAADLLIIGARVTEGLIAAHKRNIVHRDLSPDNIILRNNDPADAVIIDFGIAKDTNPGAETIVGNEFAGKYAYAAPEQLSGNTDARSDIYALGALLLATFRGAKPDIGSNPMEVVRKKSELVNVEGVPEPLKSLIARMCDPDPAKRYQTAESVLAAIKASEGVVARDLDDATVLAKPPTRAKGKSKSGQPGAKPATKGKSGLIVPLVLVAILALAGIGGYLGGLFDSALGPRLPVADPYALIVEKEANTPPRAVGNVPTPEVLAALAEMMGIEGGTADLSLATGNISATWGEAMLSLAGQVNQLDSYRIVMDGDAVRVTGLTNNKTLQSTMMETLNAALPGDLSGAVDITLGPLVLPPGAITPVLEQFADCGPLVLVSPPAIGYGAQDRILVTGKLANAGSRSNLQTAIADIAGDRPVTVDAEVLSDALCEIETTLPKAPSGGFEVRFGFGDRPDRNTTGLYFVGENPVIDVIVPAEVTSGFLWVSVLDVSGNVFHLLPNLNRADNNVATLRDGRSGTFAVRVAFRQSEATDSSKLAFLVDDSTLGKSKIIVLHSDNDLFDGLRPTTESTASYTQALKDALVTGGLRVRSLDSAILTTATK